MDCGRARFFPLFCFMAGAIGLAAVLLASMCSLLLVAT